MEPAEDLHAEERSVCVSSNFQTLLWQSTITWPEMSLYTLNVTRVWEWTSMYMKTETGISLGNHCWLLPFRNALVYVCVCVMYEFINCGSWVAFTNPRRALNIYTVGSALVFSIFFQSASTIVWLTLYYTVTTNINKLQCVFDNLSMIIKQGCQC